MVFWIEERIECIRRGILRFPTEIIFKRHASAAEAGIYGGRPFIGRFSRMKSLKIKAICIAAGISFAFSCSTTQIAEKDGGQLETETASGKVPPKEPRPIPTQNASNRQETEFKALLQDLTLTVQSAPKPVTAGKNFTSPFSVIAENKDGVVPNLKLAVSWPAGKNDNAVSYDTEVVTTDENGKASFTPPASSFAVKDKLTFYLVPVNSSAAITQIAYAAGVEIPYKVKTSYLSKEGMLYAFDCNEKGQATTNSFKLLQSLRNSGVRVGNSPISSSSYVDKPISSLYKATYDIVGSAYKFMIVGTVKFSEPPSTADGLTTVSLTADITCVNMTDGSVLCALTVSQSVTDKTRGAAEQKCRSLLADKAAEEIIYGM